MSNDLNNGEMVTALQGMPTARAKKYSEDDEEEMLTSPMSPAPFRCQ